MKNNTNGVRSYKEIIKKLTKKNVLLASILISGSLLAAGCSAADTPAPAESGQSEILKIGASAVPHAEILEHIKPDLEDQGITLEIIEFSDYVTPNLALESKELDANFFQHVPYLESFEEERGIDLENAGNVHIEPLGLYSKKITSKDQIEDNMKIALPNDPTNQGRALILLEQNEIIKLKPDSGLEADLNDIELNPKNIEFIPVEAASLPRVLEDVDCAIINTNYALEADLDLEKDALIKEGAESPYANIVAVRPENIEDERIIKLVEALQSTKVKTFIEEKYKGAVVPAF